PGASATRPAPAATTRPTTSPSSGRPIAHRSSLRPTMSMRGARTRSEAQSSPRWDGSPRRCEPTGPRRPWSLIHPLQQIFQAIEAVAPEGAVMAHPVDQGCEAAGVGAVMGLASVPTVADEASLLEDAEMFGDGGLRDPGMAGQHPDGELALADQPLE